MTHKTKAYPAKFAPLDEKEGRVEALVSIFGNVDLVGDRVVKGAFTKSIEKWKNSNDAVPAILSHDWGDPWKHIGVVDELEETPEGLRAVYTLDIHDNPLAKQVYKLMKRRSLKEHSFAYDIKDEKPAKDGANNLLELDIIELGPTLKGANPATELLAVKAVVDADKEATAEKGPSVVEKHAEFFKPSEVAKAFGIDDRIIEGKLGRSISRKTEADIRSAVEILQSILSSVEEQPEEEKSTEPKEEGKEPESGTNGKGEALDDFTLRLKAFVTTSDTEVR